MMIKTLKKIALCLIVAMSCTNVVDIEALEGTPTQLPEGEESQGTPVQLPEEVEDGVMSNPDEPETSKARGAGINMNWTIENGRKVMYDGVGKKFGDGADCKKVIDVSTYNGTIDWGAVKNGGVDGAILRATSYAGGYIKQDPQFANNVRGSKTNQMPFGVYLYSYATDANNALYEANYLINILRNNGVSPSDLTYPVYLDLEGNNYTNGIPVARYEQIVSTFINQMASAGYKTHVYSYKSYLLNNLNSPNIHKHVSWVAQYGPQLTFYNQYYSGMNGWQYQSNGRVPGVNGDVDVNCFTGLYKDVTYQTHVQGIGWQKPYGDGETSGTSGRSFRLEGMTISLPTTKYTGSIEYQTHIEGIGWQGWKRNGEVSGTSGKSLRLEAMQIRLTGEIANKYDVYYRVHAQGFGWMGWAKNAESAGSAGYSYRLEAMQIKLVPKGNPAPGETTNAYRESLVGYKTHVQGFGWQDYAFDGQSAGTTGRAYRLEGIILSLFNQKYAGGLQYQTHVEGIGWQNSVTTGQLAGTSGRALRLEAIRIKLTGDMANNYDVYYRVHAQGFGWMGWTKNGESAGTAGYAYRLEAAEIVLVPKGGAAPGSTSTPFRQR